MKITFKCCVHDRKRSAEKKENALSAFGKGVRGKMKPLFSPGDKIGITACSNGIRQQDRPQIEKLCMVLRGMGLIPEVSSCFYAGSTAYNGSAKDRADALMRFYTRDSVKAIFDVSGGDLANEILPFLKFGVIKENPKPMFGYSDLTSVLNGIGNRTGITNYLFQLRTLVWGNAQEQQERFQNTFLKGQNDLFECSWEFWQGETVEGTVAGGNIRCLLKLAGTPYFPDLKDKVLFLESLSGDEARIAAYFAQLAQMDVFRQVKGLLLGTFSELERENGMDALKRIVTEQLEGLEIPIAITKQIGHGADSRCLGLGLPVNISRAEEEREFLRRKEEQERKEQESVSKEVNHKEINRKETDEEQVQETEKEEKQISKEAAEDETFEQFVTRNPLTEAEICDDSLADQMGEMEKLLEQQSQSPAGAETLVSADTETEASPKEDIEGKHTEKEPEEITDWDSAKAVQIEMAEFLEPVWKQKLEQIDKELEKSQKSMSIHLGENSER